MDNVLKCARPALLLLFFAPGSLLAFQNVSRQEEIRALREKKAAAAAQPDKPHKIEGALLWMQERKIREKLETPGAGYKGFLQVGDESYFVVTVSHVNKHFVDVYLRKNSEGLAIVGLERK